MKKLLAVLALTVAACGGDGKKSDRVEGPVHIPEWNDSMSDGCSVNRLPKAFAHLYAADTPAQRAVCVAHDKAYYHGGTRKQREEADVRLRDDSIAAGADPEVANIWYQGARMYGGPELHKFTTSVLGTPQAWAWGGGVFKYTD